VWSNDPDRTVTVADGVTVTAIEALTLTTGAGNDEIRNTLVRNRRHCSRRVTATT
jgi:hypothetical protein